MILIDPHTPTFTEPADNEISPPAPDPLFPFYEWPLCNATSPLFSLVPALAVRSNTSPDPVLVPLSDEICIEPPIFVVFEFPTTKLTLPPF